MSELLDQIFEISNLAKFLREDASILINAHELANLTVVVQEGWQLGSKVAQLRKEPDLGDSSLEMLTKLLRHQATLVEETAKNHAQNIALLNHITRLNQNLSRMAREIPFIEDAEYRNELVITKRTGSLIDEAAFHNALREIATLFSKLGEIQPNETPTCPLSALLLKLARCIGMIENTLQVNVVYRGPPKILTVLTMLREELQREFRPIYWNVKHKYFQDNLAKNLAILESHTLTRDAREEQPIKAKKMKKQKELAEILKTLENSFNKESQRKHMPPEDSLLPELK
jgi:hypothetical protein